MMWFYRVVASPKGAAITAGDDFDLSEDVDVTNPHLNPEHFMAILIECLAVLGKIPEAVEVSKMFELLICVVFEKLV